jgi:hypothetical protein
MTLTYVPAAGDAEISDFPLGLVGADPLVRYDPAVGEGIPWRVGTQAFGQKGTTWVFVGPAAADLVGSATPASPSALAVNGSGVPSAGTGFASFAPIKTGQYAWVRRNSILDAIE